MEPLDFDDSRYYYTDPLAAAYMAKHFGMKFVSWHSGKEYDISVIEANCGSPIRSIREDQRYVIHPDSLTILHPCVGDFLIQRTKSYGEEWSDFDIHTVVDADWVKSYFDIEEAEISRGFGNDWDERTIMRNGKNFMWPEKEKINSNKKKASK